MIQNISGRPLVSSSAHRTVSPNGKTPPAEPAISFDPVATTLRILDETRGIVIEKTAEHKTNSAQDPEKYGEASKNGYYGHYLVYNPKSGLIFAVDDMRMKGENDLFRIYTWPNMFPRLYSSETFTGKQTHRITSANGFFGCPMNGAGSLSHGASISNGSYPSVSDNPFREPSMRLAVDIECNARGKAKEVYIEHDDRSGKPDFRWFVDEDAAFRAAILDSANGFIQWFKPAVKPLIKRPPRQVHRVDMPRFYQLKEDPGFRKELNALMATYAAGPDTQNKPGQKAETKAPGKARQL